VILPPDAEPTADGIKPGGWWHESDNGKKLICDLCPRACALKAGDRGFCFVRQNLDGSQIVSTSYGRSTGFCIDPIEKKPLNHFYPGTAVLSFGTAGCNLGCKFCQNWSMSKSREVASLSERADPETIAEAAKQLQCRSVAFTYNDPIIWAEYAIDTARACRAVGVKTVAVTSGYMTPVSRTAFYEVMDAANVDLKGFTEDFYWRLASGHIEPVLETLRWLVHETDVWVEITNLIIPQENDSTDELKQLCDWIAEELTPNVPLHFTAFHPDFRLRNRPRTPPETLAMAHDIARAAGIRYAYTGNLSDRSRQSTYCLNCDQVLIERDQYYLGIYALDHDRCRHCGAQVPGRFDAGPGNWGPRRMPVRISEYARPKTRQSSTRGRKEGTEMEPDISKASEAEAVQPDRPELSKEQEQLVFQAAGRRVAAAARAHPAEQLDQVLGDAGKKPLLGAFVSLKRGGQLRSCCGFLGQSMPLFQAIDHASFRAATDDPRFPPISPTELEHLEMEVWLLWGMQRVGAQGKDRAKTVTIGKHGLQIVRGQRRGLLLPGVAVEHKLDAEGFLEQVCRKAGLPPEAWKEDDSTLFTFDGHAIGGKLGSCLTGEDPQPTTAGPTHADITRLAELCRQNLVALVYGATPSLYLPGGYDGGVNGLAITVHLPQGGERIESGRVSVRPDMPLQSTLFDLCKAAAGALQARRVGPGAVEQVTVGLSALWDPALHGTAAEPTLEGVDSQRRTVIALDQGRWALAYDPQRTPGELLDQAIERARFSDRSRVAVCSMETVSMEPSTTLTNVPKPQSGPSVRPPAVAGRFYPGTQQEIDKMLDDFLPAKPKPKTWAGAMIPHAGWIYSGRLAADVLSRVKIPDRVIIISPKHNPIGADWAVAPHQTWSLPGRDLKSDPELAQQLADRVTGLELDAMAHAREHAIEVQLPIVARLAPESRVVGIAIHGGDLPSLETFAEEMAALLAELPDRPLLVVSTDMNHYASDKDTRRLDRMALDAVESLDPPKVYETVRNNRISMCGVLPAVVVMETLKRLDSLNRFDSVGYATSADASGDRSQVVGYAGMLFA
jgi:AmmeMemoRadiSam system radical SAM enzyme/AmmeMemoRadiSam system protein B/AmmeMemoRadiSam system protein A